METGREASFLRERLRCPPTPCVLQLWHELCDLISQNPDKVQSLNVDAIIRGGLTRFTDQLGKLWCSLADYYIRSGHFEKVCGHQTSAVRWVSGGHNHRYAVCDSTYTHSRHPSSVGGYSSPVDKSL